jgi:hypothetical protein
LTAEEPTVVSVILEVSVSQGQQKQVTLQFRQLASVLQAITVVATAPSLLTPDPAQSIVIHDQVLDANPGRLGAPISIPGLPIETASGGIKAPQYFAPGVAGDHGEPIAQFFQIGDLKELQAALAEHARRLRKMVFDGVPVHPERRSPIDEVIDRCAICGKPIMLEQAKVTEDGRPVHGKCYAVK